jgi:hypothetical protein
MEVKETDDSKDLGALRSHEADRIYDFEHRGVVALLDIEVQEVVESVFRL